MLLLQKEELNSRIQTAEAWLRGGWIQHWAEMGKVRVRAVYNLYRGNPHEFLYRRGILVVIQLKSKF